MNVMTLLLLLLTSSFLLAAAAAPPVALPNCQSTCGNVNIPYPFGIGTNCSMDGFQLDCMTNDGVEKPYFNGIEIINISLPEGQIRMYNPISWQCYNSNADNSSDKVTYNNATLSLIYPYRFSNTLNMFTVIGCNTFAYLVSYVNGNASYLNGCVTTCNSEKISFTNGSCSGVGCCQTTPPEYYTSYVVQIEIESIPLWQSNNGCSYGVLLEASWFNFSSSYVTTGKFLREQSNGAAPVVVDWAIGNDSCAAAKLNKTSSACVAENSECVDAANGPGYLCKCSSGYHGNPYLSSGCGDIDECSKLNIYPCFRNCVNSDGSYSCSCPAGTYGNAKTGICYPLGVKLVIGISAGLFFLLLLGMCIYLGHERRKLRLAKKKISNQHGGRQLLEEIEAKQGLAFKIFEHKELEQATNKFENNRILGQGGNGTVYKGILEDEAPVAIKKSKSINEKQKEEFGREMIFLSRIKHKNIVKLLGCCLEMEVPMLVYEFISNGDLFHLIHQQSNTAPVSLATRLRIACESAEALAYLHSSASPPILHGDVKSSNILLDDSYTAKLSDFGASILAPNDESQFAALVQGTLGYLDPECVLTRRLTDKSDVYSFGVVLAELLTGRKALTFEGSEAKSLASIFVSAMNEGRLVEIIDSQVKDAEGEEGLIQQIGELVNRCLRILGEERPTMKEVADELGKLIKLREHAWLLHNADETERLLSQQS